MSIEPSEPQRNDIIKREHANLIAQSLNVVFNNATFYGGGHPSTQKSAEDFALRFNEIFSFVPMVTFLRTGDSLYIEKWCVDDRMNVPRFITIFQKTGIESISFEKGTTANDVKALITVFSDLETFPNIEAMKKEFEQHGVHHIRFNYVFYQKVTEDDAVVHKEDLGDGTSISSPIEIQSDISREVMPEWVPESNKRPITHDDSREKKVISEIGKLFTLRALIDNPGTMANSILAEAYTAEDRTQSVIKNLRSIHEKIRLDDIAESDLSLDELIESVFELTSELKQGLSVQRQIGTILDEEDQVIDAVDQLTYQAIITIIREEYKQGSVSIKRLSTIIRRILPDVKDLKKLLPQLKNGLLAAGMSLTDFLELTRELHKELERDGLLQALEDGAERIGLAVEDIVQAINTNPEEAAKIIVLASEIKQGAGTDQANLSNLLTDYIESISRTMALESPETTDQDGGHILEQVIQQLETQFVDKLKKQGITDTVVGDVEKQLAEKFPRTLRKLKADWMVRAITDEQDVSSTNILELIGAVVDKKSDFSSVKGPLAEALRTRGFDTDQVEDVCKEIVTRLEKKKTAVTLPKNVLSSNNTRFFLQREIKENLRYHNPFSCIVISVTAKLEEGSWLPMTKEDIAQAIPAVCEVLRGFLRDLDLIGSFGRLEGENIIIIMPMTDEKGAFVVKDRLDKKFLQSDFKLDGETVELNIVISVTPFDSRKKLDYAHFKELIETRHKIEEDMYNKL